MYKTGILAVTVLMAGCAASSHEPSSVGMPNPASAYCINLGGALSIEQTAGGQIGICTLPDGVKIEEWELFRRDHQQTQS